MAQQVGSLATFTLDQRSILRTYLCRLITVCNSSSRGMTPILLKRRESPQIHTYPIHMNKKMNAKIFFVHRSKYHKSDYKFHHTDSYNHSRYLSCGLSCLGHSQVAENIRCLILIFWENNFVTGKPLTDRVTTLPPHCSICLVSCRIGRCLWWLEKQYHHSPEWSLYQGLSGEDLQCGIWYPPWSW